MSILAAKRDTHIHTQTDVCTSMCISNCGSVYPCVTVCVCVSGVLVTCEIVYVGLSVCACVQVGVRML